MYYLKFFRTLIFLSFTFFASYFTDCSKTAPPETSEQEQEAVTEWISMTVTASAYNSLKNQGIGNVNITAWGDTLKPGMKSIAVSHDLIEKGLTYMTPVKIQGLIGIYIVNDKMHSRWNNKIDIYMGVDRKKALKWGRKKVEICFPAPAEEVLDSE